MAAPAPMPVRLTVCCAESSPMVSPAIASRVGASFTGVTVMSKVRMVVLLVGALSSTVTVMVAVPWAFGLGVNVSVPATFGVM